MIWWLLAWCFLNELQLWLMGRRIDSLSRRLDAQSSRLDAAHFRLDTHGKMLGIGEGPTGP